ncbi:YdgA family protein, partial [bacterium]|nr:YdgA family protein [bacterium]
TVMLPPSWGGTSVVFTTRSVINLDGSMASSLVIPAFMRALQTGLTVDVQEVKGEVKHSRNLAEMHVAVAAPGARIDSKEGGLAIAGVSLKSDIVNTTNGIPTGRSELAVAHLLASSCGKATGSFGLASLTLTSDLDQNGDVIDYCVNSTIASLHIGTQTFGPGVLSLAVSNVHAASMAELGAAVDDFRQAGADPAAAKFAGLMLAAKLASVLPGMAAHGLRFSLPQCRMASPEGDYSITALATLKPAEDASAFNPLAMLNMLDADIDVRLPASFVEPKLAQAEASGRGAGLFAYLKKSGSEYTMNMTFHDGMLKVNGEQAGLPLGRDRQRKR